MKHPYWSMRTGRFEAVGAGMLVAFHTVHHGSECEQDSWYRSSRIRSCSLGKVRHCKTPLTFEKEVESAEVVDQKKSSCTRMVVDRHRMARLPVPSDRQKRSCSASFQCWDRQNDPLSFHSRHPPGCSWMVKTWLCCYEYLRQAVRAAQILRHDFLFPCSFVIVFVDKVSSSVRRVPSRSKVKRSAK